DGVGDMNGDGKDDVIVGGLIRQGGAFVVFGKASSTTVNLPNIGSQGFLIKAQASHQLGASVSGAGDVNGDGRPDVIVEDTGGFNDNTVADVIFGKADTNTVDTAALGGQGFRMSAQGANIGSPFPTEVAGAGDV